MMMEQISSRPLSLLQVLETSGGGSGRHFLDLSGALKARGHRITAIYSPVRAEDRFVRDLEALKLAGVYPVAMTRAPGPSDLRCFAQIHRIIRECGPFDIVHAHSSKAGALSRLRLPGRHVPRVYTPHAFRTMDPDLGRTGRLVFGAIETLLGRFLSDRVICVSQDEYDHAVGLGIPPSRLRTVINGVEPPPVGERAALRARFQLPADALVFGFIGRLLHQKAPERLVAAFAEIAARVPEAHLMMVGFGEMENEIRGRIAASGFADRIRLTNDITGPTAIEAFDLLVMPSRYEAMSYVMLEAAAAGKPMILTDVGGASRVLDHGVNGLLVPNSDAPQGLADAMLAFADPRRRAAFEGHALARKNRYALRTMVDEIEALYRELAGMKGATLPLTQPASALIFRS